MIKILKSHVNADEFISNVNEIAYDIVLQCFDSEKILSGNLDARKVKEFSRKYKFSISLSPIVNSDGSYNSVNSDSLLTVKRKRNELAHATYSFKECGKYYTIQDLVIIKNHVIEYLKQILNNIDLYITNQEYLETSTH